MINIFFNYLIIIILFISGLILRSYLLLKYKYTGKDSFGHLIYAEEIRKKRKISISIDRYVVPIKFDYPPFLPILISLFDKKYYQKLQFLSPVIDTITGLIIFFFCVIFFQIEIAIISTAIYLFTPINLDISIYLGSRTFGNFFMTIAILSLIVFLINELIIFFIISIIFSSLVLITHRMTTQSLIAVMICFSILLFSFTPLIILLISFILALLITRGFYLKIFLGHIKFIRLFIKKVFNKKTRNEVYDILPNPIKYFFNIPIIIILPIIVLFYYKNPNYHMIVLWCLTLSILSIMWVFGQGMRYMINAIPSISILSAVWIVDSDNYILGLMLIFISLTFSLFKIYRAEKKTDLGDILNKNIMDGFNYINSNKNKNDILLCLPLDFTNGAAYFTNCTMMQSSGGSAEGQDFNQNLHKKVKDGKINDLIKKYHIDWIITINKNYNITAKEEYGLNGIKIFKPIY